MLDEEPPVLETRLLTKDEFSHYVQKHRSIPSYDSSCESKGDHPFWDLPRDRIDAGLKSIHAKLAEVLTGIPSGDRELKHLDKTRHTIGQIKCGLKMTFGLIGAQGSGKSMFINALFDRAGISWSGADGEACTSIPVKYAQSSATSTAANAPPYCGEVKFLDAKKIEEMIREQVRYLKIYHRDAEDSDDEEPQGNQSYEQDDIEKNLCNTAHKVLRMLIGSEEDFLANWLALPTEEFIHFCQRKSLQAINKYSVDHQNVFREEANTPHELLSRIRHFLADLEGVDCLWPLVDHVTIRFDHPLLRYGAVFIDVPGCGDTNVMRARHVEEIKATADVLLVFADTVRIGSQERDISLVHRCIASHGITKVKLIATKIDALLQKDLQNCEGAAYDEIRQHIQEAREEERAAAEDGDPVQTVLSGQFVTYLERRLLLHFVVGRAARLARVLGKQLNGRKGSDTIQIFHTSASNYLEWQARPKINFRDQPPLPPARTGIPDIRQHFFSLLAPMNLNDVVYHLNTLLPNYLEKIARVINESDRDADFASLAEAFDHEMDELMNDLLSQTKRLFQKILKDTFSKVCTNTAVYKKQIENKICNEVCKLRGPTFNKLMKFRGTLPPKASKAKGLENGCSYNRDFSNVLAPVFLKWNSAYNDRIQPMRQSLDQIDRLVGSTVLSMLNSSPANVMVVERAKTKWKPYRSLMKTKMNNLMNEFERYHENSMLEATMEDGRQNCLVAMITDKHFDAVFEAEPPQESDTHPKNKKFREPKAKYQKRILNECFFDSNRHFVDDVLKLFYDRYSKSIDNILGAHFQQTFEILNQYSASLKEEAPISYKVEKGGMEIRTELEVVFPSIKRMVEDLQKELPDQTETETDGAAWVPDMDGASNLAAIYAQVSRKRKRSTQDTGKEIVKKEKY